MNSKLGYEGGEMHSDVKVAGTSTTGSIKTAGMVAEEMV